MQDFHNLSVWHKAHALAVNIHRLTSTISSRGNSGFVSQMRRSAEAIPANIAEGSGRNSDADFAQYIQIAIASASELESHLQYAADTELLPSAMVEARRPEVIEVRRMLIGFQKKIAPARFKKLPAMSSENASG